MICLLIVDRSQVMREIMSVVIREEHDLQISAFASTRDEAVAKMNGCDAVLVSAHLPDDAACAVISAIAAVRPGVKILAIDVANRDVVIDAYAAAGAADCVLEEDSVDELLMRLRALLGDGSGVIVEA